YILKRNPLRCGLMKYDLYLNAQFTGYKFAAEGERVWAMAHLYVAGGLLHPDAPAWPDMEHVIWRQNPEWLFFGGKPKSLDEAHRKYRLGLG
ncbi:hypothetical protein K491DRAFT_549820, partial [Lophiostoma macrostomum CBS 122681]